MDRWLMSPGDIPLTEMLLGSFKNSMINAAMLAEAVLGQSTRAYGLAPTALGSGAVSGAAIAVQIGRGCIFAYETTDPEAYGVLGTDSTTILKTGINLAPQNVGITNGAPVTSGQSVNYLITAAFSEQDGSPQSVPRYNGSMPSSPTIAASVNTLRSETVVLGVVAGTPATTGTQTTPAAASGTIPLWVVTVNFGDTAAVQGQITEAPNAAFVPPLATVQPGGKASWLTAGTYSFTVPPGVFQIKKAEVTAGGGGGGGSAGTGNTYSGSGGAAGGTVRGSFAVTPGQVLTIIVGAGGTAGTGSANAGNGGSSSVGSFITATGGYGGLSSTSSGLATQGLQGGGGTTSGCTWSEVIPGGYGMDGYYAGGEIFTGDGGASSQGGGGRSAANTSSAAAQNGQAPGSGAGGIYSVVGSGGTGAAGRVYLEW